MIKILQNRHVVYNETLVSLKQLEAQGKALVLAPQAPLSIGRFEKDKIKLQALYEQGFIVIWQSGGGRSFLEKQAVKFS